MDIGIVGLPNVGKSSLFNALTAAGADASNYPFCTISPNIGIVAVPDRRVDRIAEFIPTARITSATLQMVDIAGLVRGASRGEGLGNQFLAHIREVDAILHVVRCFENPQVIHLDGPVDAWRDIETIGTELMLADLESVENSLERAGKAARGGDPEAAQRLAMLEQCHAQLAQGRPVRQLVIQKPELRLLVRGMGLLTAKRILYVANVNEDDLRGEGPQVAQIRRYAEQNGGEVVPLCVRIESELAELEESVRQEMLESLGMEEPALHRVARAAYHLLGLHSFFTAGEKEVRAWTVRIGTTARQAAGVIHSDFERGFIRAEVYQYDDLMELKSEQAIRAAGRMRIEGRNYLIQDGDICHFLFNV